MPNQSIQSPSGKEMFLVTNKTTTNTENKEIKKIFLIMSLAQDPLI